MIHTYASKPKLTKASLMPHCFLFPQNLKLQFSLEQHRIEAHSFTEAQIFFSSKCILLGYTFHGSLTTRMWNISSVQSFSSVPLFVTHALQHTRLPCALPNLRTCSKTHVYQVGDAIQPSHSLSSPSPPAFNLSQHQGLFQ